MWLSRFAVLLLLLFVIGAVLSNQAFFYSETFARRIARKRLDSFLRRSGKHPAELRGGERVEMGDALWAFEWQYSSVGRTYGVWLSRNGSAEIYSFSDKNISEPDHGAAVGPGD